MINLIVGAIVIAIVFFSRNFWAPRIVSLFRKEKTVKIGLILNENRKVFAPVGTVRTFYVAIEMTEEADGTASFDIKKLKTDI